MSLNEALTFRAQLRGQYVGLAFRWNWAKLQGPQYFDGELAYNRRMRRIVRMRLLMLRRRHPRA